MEHDLLNRISIEEFAQGWNFLNLIFSDQPDDSFWQSDRIHYN